MTEGDITLTPLAQSDGRIKPRPAMLLKQMPPFDDWLICGISTQLHQEVPGFDDKIEPSHPDFRRSGLKAASIIRLGFLAVLPANHFLGFLGSVSPERHAKLLQRLSTFLATK
jgi:mRNA interferase MazF